MRQQLVKNLVFVLLINLVVKAVWIFFIDRNVQIRVGYAHYGAYQAFFNLSMIFMVLLDFGLAQYTGREVATDHKRIRVLFSSMFWTRLMLSAVYAGVVFLFAAMLGYQGDQLYLLAGVLSIQALSSMLVFLRSNVAALQFFRTDGVLAVIDRMLMILLCGSLLLLPGFSDRFRIEWFVWSQIACYLVAVLTAIVILLRISPVPIHFSWRPQIIRKVVRESAPYALLMFLMSVYMRSDSVMIERLCGGQGKVQAGIYASAFRLLDVANIFGIMFAGILLPMFSKALGNKENIAPLVRLAVNIMMPVSFIAAVLAVFFGAEIMQLLYHKHSGGSDAFIFSVLMCSFPAYCLMYIYSTLLTAKGSIVLLNRISFGVVLLNLALHFLLIPSFQATGASFAVLCTEWVVAACVISGAHRSFTLPHDYRWIGTHLGFVLSLCVSVFAIRQLPVVWNVQIFLAVVVAMILLLAFRFWTWKSLLSLLRRRES